MSDTMTEVKKARVQDTHVKLLRHMEATPMQAYHYEDWADRIDAESTGTVCSCLSRWVRNKPYLGIERVVSGTYRYNPDLVTSVGESTESELLEPKVNPTPTIPQAGDVLEVLARTEDGGLVLRCEQGIAWLAKKA